MAFLEAATGYHHYMMSREKYIAECSNHSITLNYTRNRGYSTQILHLEATYDLIVHHILLTAEMNMSFCPIPANIQSS